VLLFEGDKVVVLNRKPVYR